MSTTPQPVAPKRGEFKPAPQEIISIIENRLRGLESDRVLIQLSIDAPGPDPVASNQSQDRVKRLDDSVIVLEDQLAAARTDAQAQA